MSLGQKGIFKVKTYGSDPREQLGCHILEQLEPLLFHTVQARIFMISKMDIISTVSNVIGKTAQVMSEIPSNPVSTGWEI